MNSLDMREHDKDKATTSFDCFAPYKLYINVYAKPIATENKALLKCSPNVCERCSKKKKVVECRQVIQYKY